FVDCPGAPALGNVAGGAAGVVQSPRDDARGVNGDAWLGFGDGFGASPDLQAPGPPRWQHLVDDDGGAPGACGIPDPLAGPEVVAGDVDDVGVTVEGPSDRGDMGHAVGADGGDSGKPPLAPEVGQLGVSEYGHDRSSFGMWWGDRQSSAAGSVAEPVVKLR